MNNIPGLQRLNIRFYLSDDHEGFNEYLATFHADSAQLPQHAPVSKQTTWHLERLLRHQIADCLVWYDERINLLVQEIRDLRAGHDAELVQLRGRVGELERRLGEELAARSAEAESHRTRIVSLEARIGAEEAQRAADVTAINSSVSASLGRIEQLFSTSMQRIEELNRRVVRLEEISPPT